MKNFRLNFKSIVQRKARWSLTLIAILTLGVGQMWADTGFYNCYFTYNDGSNHSQNQDASGMANKSLGTLSSNLTIKAAYLKVWDNNGSSSRKLNNGQFCYTIDNWSHTSYAGEGGWTQSDKDGNNYELQKSSVTWTLASLTDASGSYTLKYYWQAWGDGNKYLNNGGSNYQFTYKIRPPEVDGGDFTVTSDDYVSGSGADEDHPILITNGLTSTTFIVTANKAHSDANSKLWVSFDNGSNWSQGANATATTVTSGSKTVDGTVRYFTIKVKFKHNTESLESATVLSKTIYYKEQPAGITVNAGSNGTVSVNNSTWSESEVIEDISLNTWYNIYAKGNTHYDFGSWSKGTNSSNITLEGSTASTRIKIATGAVSSVTANFVEHPYTITIENGTAASTTAGVSTLIGQATANPPFGKRFTSWTKPASNFTLVGGTSTSSTTIKFNATANGTVTANFAQNYAYVVGRFHVRNSSPSGSWINSFGNNESWSTSTANIRFEYDNTNHRFYLHTYATPSELSSNISEDTPYFHVKTSTSSSSITGGTEYWPASNTTLDDAAKGVKKSIGTTGSNNYKFSSTNTTSYVILYFDGSDLWYDLEQSLKYNANGGTGSKSTTYHIKGSSTTAPAANTFSRTGYTFSGWNTAPNGSGASYAAGASVTMSSNITLYAQWTENKTSITITTDGHGTITTPDPNDSPYSLGVATMQNINATANEGYHWNTWTASGTAVLVSSAATQSNTVKGNGTSGSTGTVTATFTPNTYTVQFHRNGGAGETVYQNFTYDVAQDLTANTYTKTGYNFAGWATAADGTVAYTDEEEVSNLTSTNEGTFDLYAKWTPKSCTVTFDFDEEDSGYDSKTGADENVTATYDAAMTSVTPPTAATGYAFMGFYDEADGAGKQYYDGTGASANNWDKDTESATTLYAYYKKAAITTLTLSSAIAEPSTSITVTPTIDPEPTPTTIICWKLLYSNDSEYDPQPTFTPGDGNAVSFTVPAASGTYKVQAQLRTGSSCGGGDLLSESLTSFVVAGLHDVTIQYKCGDVTVKAATVLEGVKPLEWSEAITPGDAPFGYSFHHWEAGDGVTISTNGSSAIGKDTTHTATIYIKAIFDGRLTAVYTQKQMIYFKNTLGWDNVFVNFYTSSYWDNPKGTGNESVTNRNKKMTRIGESDVWYFDYGYNDGGSSISPSLYVSFTGSSRDNVQYFWGKNPFISVVYPANYQDDIHTDKSSENGFKAATPMFVPLAEQTATDLNPSDGGKACYYNRGYWTTYTAGTGYTLEIYGESGGHIKSIEFTSEDDLMPMQVVTDLEANTTYQYQLRRGGTDDAGIYYGNSGKMTYNNRGVGTGWALDNSMVPFKMARIATTAAGDYTFNLSYSANADGAYRLRMEVDYPISNGDYRVIYKDDVHTEWHPSAIVTKANDSKDTVSFFIRPGENPTMKIQQSTVAVDGTITWSSGTDVSSSLSALSKDSVYNICLTMNGSGAISVENVEGYSGNYYIRTDAANSKWDNYCALDHQMTYSEYATKKTESDYTHYWMAYVPNTKNVKCVIANDYSPCISDTLIQQTARGGDSGHVDEEGNIKANANVRFMWDIRNNNVLRAYLAPAQNDGSKFLVLQGQATKLLAPDGSALSDAAGNNKGGGTDAIQFTDKENWMYDAEVSAIPGGRVKLYAVFHESTFYYYGDADASFEDGHAIDLISGTGDAQAIRVVYDFKTDRLIAAWMPSDATISSAQTIDADIMLIREHQEQGKQINLEGTGSISTSKTVYGVMRFNRWTLNNKSTINTGTVENPVHAVLPIGDQKSQYERFNYFISFPFDVKVGEIFGFGTIGRHYRLFYYDGLGRAKEGFFAERGDDNWRMIDDTDSILHANQGYLLQLNYIRMADDNTSTWPQKNMNEVELYFPAMNNINRIKLDDVVIPALGDDYKCTINLQPTYHALNNPDSTEADRRVKDSYWRCIGVPGFTSYEAVADEWTNFDWTTDTDTLPYLYEWQMIDNSLNVVSTSKFTFKPMHAYLIQNGKSFTWTGVAHPTIVSAPRRSAAEEGFYEFYLDLQKDEKSVDHTYVRLSDKENVTTDFDFGQDLSKEMKANYNIYTKVAYERLAANNLPLTDQTTIVPVGVKVAEEGYYTFAMPEGTHGVGVTLIDNETSDRTNLSLFDYTVNLTKGEHANRFSLEISPIKNTPTAVENVQEDNAQNTSARKVMVDGILYIVKEGKVFDAQGRQVK